MGGTRVIFTKWGGRPHWEYDAIRLGDDEHGTWLGLPVGTCVSRPGSSFLTGETQVVLVPHDQPFVATFYASGGAVPCKVYVDITTPPVREPGTVRVVDLDLDVLQGWTGRVWVDDEDEFADHRARYGYPDEVVRTAIGTCERVRNAIESGGAPYDGVTSERWLSRLAATVAG